MSWPQRSDELVLIALLGPQHLDGEDLAGTIALRIIGARIARLADDAGAGRQQLTDFGAPLVVVVLRDLRAGASGRDAARSGHRAAVVVVRSRTDAGQIGANAIGHLRRQIDGLAAEHRVVGGGETRDLQAGEAEKADRHHEDRDHRLDQSGAFLRTPLDGQLHGAAPLATSFTSVRPLGWMTMSKPGRLGSVGQTLTSTAAGGERNPSDVNAIAVVLPSPTMMFEPTPSWTRSFASPLS